MASVSEPSPSRMVTMVLSVLEPHKQISKWHVGTRDHKVGDIVCLREEPAAPTKWPLAKIIKIHPGQDRKLRIVSVKTAKEEYTRPVVKLVPLVQQNE